MGGRQGRGKGGGRGWKAVDVVVVFVSRWNPFLRHRWSSSSSGLALFGGESRQKLTVGLILVADCGFPLEEEEEVEGGRRTEPVGLRSTEGR